MSVSLLVGPNFDIYLIYLFSFFLLLFLGILGASYRLRIGIKNYPLL
jgi:hypothetical protein